MMDDGGFLQDEPDVPAFRRATREYLQHRVADGTFRGWIAEIDGEPVASAAVIVWPKPPGTNSHTPGEAYLLNVYTRPEHRGRGLASALTERILEWCEEQGLQRMSLHATEAGARVYSRFGFKPRATEMILRRPNRPASPPDET